jgi:hypothetical protein
MDMNIMTLEMNNNEELEKHYPSSFNNIPLEMFLDSPDYNISEKIIQIFKWDSYYSTEDKILITNYILYYNQQISSYKDFYEEECHLVLTNWIYNLRHEIQASTHLDPRIYHLLYNILNIFESFPIDLKDLLTLNIYERLNKIRKNMKKINFIIYCKVDRLLNYWKTFSNDNMLNKKRLREFEEEYMSNLIGSDGVCLKKVNFVLFL